MSPNWQYRIQKFEIHPPADAWEKISDKLEEEYDPSETLLSQKLHDFEIAPPSIVFDKIVENLKEEEPVAKQGKVFSIPFKRVAVAAAAIGLMIVSVLYFLNPRSASAPTSTADILPVVPGNSKDLVERVEPKRQTTDTQNQNSVASILSERSPRSGANGTSRNSSTRTNIKQVNLNPVAATNASISVNAPPIYDGHGNVIMDETLVSAPDENYIIVTSPNGEQTKISRKFLKMLCVMNGGSDNYYVNPENFFWKIRFEEWRSKLLQQASYMPTANNFLDIMALKEMLQEN